MVDFYIGDNLVPSIFHEEHNFLCKMQFFHGKSQDTFDFLKDTFKARLDNVDNLMIRNEQQILIDQNYFISSIRFLLPDHELSMTHVKQLDAFTHTYLKRWAGLPPSATNLVIHMKMGLDIPQIETLYHTCHTLSHTSMRLKGDITMNAALNSAISRESKWSHNKKTVVAAETAHTYVMNKTCPTGEMPAFQTKAWKRKVPS